MCMRMHARGPSYWKPLLSSIINRFLGLFCIVSIISFILLSVVIILYLSQRAFQGKDKFCSGLVLNTDNKD